jgi:2-methylisocitrate lyase-like PEP mutase family enzyme
MPGKSLHQTLLSKEFFVAPGIQDMITAIVANRVGFDFVYGSGYWTIASAHGLPDAGIATYTQMVGRMRTLAQISNSTLIADADTGYGGLLNVHHTVRGYEEAGVTGIQLEDQVFPKKCGHVGEKHLIPAEDMAKKIRVACAARRDPQETVIIARTDALLIEGYDGAMRRMDLYAAAGADMLFLEAAQDPEQMRKACASTETPMMANMADGGSTPILDAATLEELGYAGAIFPAMCSLHAAAAAEQALIALKTTGTSLKSGLEMFNFQDFSSMIGFDEIAKFDEEWR